MADQLDTLDTTLDELEATSFDRPPAIIANAHITGLAVARALSAHNIPVIALDRTTGGVAIGSNSVDFAVEVAYPLSSWEAFHRQLGHLVDAIGGPAVAFGCMDEWVRGFANADVSDLITPTAGAEIVDQVLDKSTLYQLAEEYDIPYPTTFSLESVDAATVLKELEYPFVVKPHFKREFEEAFGDNVIEVTNDQEFAAIREAAERHSISILAQEKVDIAAGRDRSVVSYVSQKQPIDDDHPTTLSVVGSARLRYPAEYGTSCFVELVTDPGLERQVLPLLSDVGYYGISEAEFVYDRVRECYVLLDINTRPWKWIDLPVQAGANLPLAAYEEATSANVGSFDVSVDTDMKWVYLRDYLNRLWTDSQPSDLLSSTEWESLISGEFEQTTSAVTTAVYRPSDPVPLVGLLRSEFEPSTYYCAC